MIRISEEKIRSIFDHAIVGFCVTDLYGRLEDMNPAFCEITGYSKEELQKKDFYQITHPDDRDKKREDVRRMLAGEVPAFRAEKRYICKDGSVVWVQNCLSLIRDEHSQPKNIVVVVQDITDEKILQDALTMAKNQAEIANLAKSQFLANMSHEIRTPLGAILGFANLVRDPVLGENDRQKYLDIICRSGQALSQLVDDILDLSKIEMGHLQIELTEFSLQHLVSEVLSLLSFKAQEKGVTLIVEGDTPEMVNSDPTRIRQILTNVIGNAVKFTAAGKVTVTMSHHHEDNGQEMVSVRVDDTGPGMTQEQQQRLFKPFAQADNSMARKYGGTGLGLELSRRLARALGGDVELIQSEVGRGSSFLITVHVTKSKEDRMPSQLLKEESLDGIKVLLVDDSPDNQTLIQHILKKYGAQTECSDNGADGIQKVMEKNFDIVLMDIQMPNVDGYQATAKLRSLGFKKPIIALTAHALKEDRDRCFSVGCDAYLTKPINAIELNQAIFQLTKK